MIIYGALSAPANIEQYAKVAILPRSPGGWNYNPEYTFLRWYEGTTQHISIAYDCETGKVAAYRSSTLLGVSGSPLGAGEWNCLEIYVRCHNTEGLITVKNNGNTIMTLSGTLDTRNGGTAGTLDTAYLGVMTGNLVDGNDYFYLDDIVLADTWSGQGGLYVMPAIQDGSDIDWTASDAGARWDCVDELPPSFTDYIYADGATPNLKNTVGFGAMPITPANIAFVGVYARGKLDAAGAANVRAIAKSGATYSNGTAVNLGTDPAYVKHIMTLEPSLSAAWDQAAVEALNVGVETQ